MLKFIGGVALSIFILGVLGVDVSFDKRHDGWADKVTSGMTQAEVDDLINLGVQRKLIQEKLASSSAQMVVTEQSEQDREQTVSENPNASGGSVSVQDYYSAVQQ